MPVTRTPWVLSAGLAIISFLFVWPVLAQDAPAAPDVTQQCVDAHLTTQQLRKAAKLSAAKDALLICVQEGCPKPIKDDCGGWLAEIDAQIPSVVVTAKGKDGRDTTDVRVLIDGVKVADRLDGVAIDLDPGPHEIGCEHQGDKRVEKVVAVQAQKSRPITCSFYVAPERRPPEPPAADAPQAIAGYVIGVLSLGGFASFAAFGIIGTNDASELNKSCGPDAPEPFTQTCTDDQIDPVEKKLLVADISLIGGVSLLAVSMGLLLDHFLSSPDDETPTVQIDVGPTLGGAAGQLTLSF